MRAIRQRPADMYMPRLLACDLDGTLLDETGSLRPAVRNAIVAVRAAGVEVVLATGRSPWAVAEIARALGMRGPQIVMNGGAYVSPVTCEVVWARRLDPELVIEGLAFASGLGSSPLLGFLDGHARQRAEAGESETPDFAVGPRLRQVDSLQALAGDGPVRVYVPTSPREHGRAVAEAVDWFGGRASIVFSDRYGFEIMLPGTNKGEALRRIAAAMRIDREQVAAVGDGPNDREMLEYAGSSAALLPIPGSAPRKGPILAEATRVVPSSAHDGAVEAIRLFFPRLDLGPIRPLPLRPVRQPAAQVGATRPPDWDDDPEPDLDQPAA
jgi:Cof subfamily protein (haloacid dehalogenase superfamily)